MDSFILLGVTISVFGFIIYLNHLKYEDEKSKKYKLFQQDIKTKDIIGILPNNNVIKFSKNELIDIYNFLYKNEIFKWINDRDKQIKELNILARSITIKNRKINPNLSEMIVKEWVNKNMKIEENALPDMN